MGVAHFPVDAFQAQVETTGIVVVRAMVQAATMCALGLGRA
jgi:hypothetical protein